MEPELVAEGAAPPGGEVDLAIHMRTKPGWHGYWLNPGDAGLPMDVSGNCPRASGRTIALSRAEPPRDRRIDELRLRARLCGAGPAQGAGERAGTIPIRASATGSPARTTLRARAGRSRRSTCRSEPERRTVPSSINGAAHCPVRSLRGAFRDAGDKLRIAVPLPASVAVDKPYLFPEADGIVDYDAKQSFSRDGDLLIAELARKDMTPKDFAGVIAIGDDRGFEFRAVPRRRFPPSRAARSAGRAADWVGAARRAARRDPAQHHALRLPDPSLKALHLARAGERRARGAARGAGLCGRRDRRTGALGAMLLVIRAAGAEAGWAFQLQDPRAIMLLLLLAVAISAQPCWPVRAAGARRRRRARPGSFFTGALAAFIATPCTGPFMGAALGAALAASRWRAALCSPGSAWVSRCRSCWSASCRRCAGACRSPGAWMERLQRILADADGADRRRLAVVLCRQTGVDALTWGCRRRACVLGIALWWCGRGRPLVRLGAARVARRGGAGDWPWCPSRRRAPRRRGPLGAEPFSEAALPRCARAGTPVFVYFTADWCLTCKVNEARRDRPHRGRATRSASAASRCWSATGPTATPRSAASSSRGPRRRAALPLVCARATPAAGAAADPHRRRCLSPALARPALGRALPYVLPGNPGFEHLGRARGLRVDWSGRGRRR